MKRVAMKWFGLVLALISITPIADAAAQRASKRAITQIAGDLYRFQNNFHFSVFYVTDEGVLVTDPINADAAKWLKAEIAKRFNKPIKYLVYSHDHPDHISGGEIFADTATIIAHENARAAIVNEKRPTPAPQLTFSDSMTVHLGGRRIELSYVGRSHSDNMLVIRFPRERTLFAVDFISIRRVGFKTLGDSYWPDWIDAIRAVESMDFEILAPGHGPLGKKADAAEHRQYLEDLYTAVIGAAREGLSLEQMKKTIKLEKYKGWGQYKNWLPLNIEGVYNRVKLQRRGG